MKPKYSVLTLLVTVFFFASCVNPDEPVLSYSGEFRMEQSMESQILGRGMDYVLYLPPYYDARRSYPILYFLSGMGDTPEIWLNEVRKIGLDNLINGGVIQPVIIVVPNSGNTFYMNAREETGEQYEDFFFQELLPHIESLYPIAANKRFIGGVSMGGYGSLIYGLRHPERFAGCFTLCGSMRTLSDIEELNQPSYDGRYGQALSPYPMTEAGAEYYRENYDPESLVQTYTAQMPLWIACGTGDYLYPTNQRLHEQMTELNIPHEWRASPGQHSPTWWLPNMKEALIWISN